MGAAAWRRLTDMLPFLLPFLSARGLTGKQPIRCVAGTQKHRSGWPFATGIFVSTERALSFSVRPLAKHVEYCGAPENPAESLHVNVEVAFFGLDWHLAAQSAKHHLYLATGGQDANTLEALLRHIGPGLTTAKIENRRLPCLHLLTHKIAIFKTLTLTSISTIDMLLFMVVADAVLGSSGRSGKSPMHILIQMLLCMRCKPSGCCADLL